MKNPCTGCDLARAGPCGVHKESVHVRSKNPNNTRNLPRFHMDPAWTQTPFQAHQNLVCAKSLHSLWTVCGVCTKWVAKCKDLQRRNEMTNCDRYAFFLGFVGHESEESFN
jgi:hypothetical protein